MRMCNCAGLVVAVAGSLAQGAVNFTGVDLATVSSAAGQNFAYTDEGSGATGTLNVKLIDGQVQSLTTGAAPDVTGFYALQSVNNLTPATFRFTFDSPKAFRVDQNETLTNIETNTFTLAGGDWDILSVSNASVTDNGSSVSFLGQLSVPPYGTYSIRASGLSFDFQIVNSNAFPLAGSAISLSVVPEPLAAVTLPLICVGLLRRQRARG